MEKDIQQPGGRPALPALIPAYIFTMYAVFLLTFLLFTLKVDFSDPATALLLGTTIPFTAFLWILPVVLLAGLGWLCVQQIGESTRYWIMGVLLFIGTYPVHLFLLMDAGLYFRYGYHVNPHVINIFTTPGGFEAMGLRSDAIISLGTGILLLALLHATVILAFMMYDKLSVLFAGPWTWRRSLKVYTPIVLLLALLFCISFMSYAFNHFKMNAKPLLAADAVPYMIKGTSGSLFKKLGMEQPERDAMRVELADEVHLNAYPQNPVNRIEHPKYNIVWLTCESLPARLCTPEIMPATHKFAEKGVKFNKHYSGGNVTRQGVFSQFYALPGSYWKAFLAASRGPLLIDWLIEDGYSIECFTSAKFTYPEFDRTVFYKVPSENLHEDSQNGLSWERDQRNLKRVLDVIDSGAAAGNPFFVFMFFESAHNPYNFPDDAVIEEDYIKDFDEALVTQADSIRIMNRAKNAVHHLDMCLAQIYQKLEEKDLLKNTIVIVAGDHGEEYFEKGYLGHSSAFVEEQTRTPLVLYYPGIKPGEYNDMSSHNDIVPMIAGQLGVTNDPADYACGWDLLAEGAEKRRYCLQANWDEVFFTGEKFKTLIPLDTLSYAKQVITDANDTPLGSVDEFYAEHNADLLEVQNDLTRFTEPAQSHKSGNLLFVFIAAAAEAVIAIIAIMIYLLRRKKKQDSHK